LGLTVFVLIPSTRTEIGNTRVNSVQIDLTVLRMFIYIRLLIRLGGGVWA
jgi:hypothetical protein